MKKIIALGLIAVFIFSLIPSSFAQNNGSGSIRDTIEDIRDTREDIRDITNVDRQRCIEKCQNEGYQNCEERCRAADIRENSRDLGENIRENLREARILRVRSAADLNARNISAQRLADLRERYENARERYEEAKEGLQDARQRLRHSLQSGNQTGTFEHAKNYLLRTADALINHLEKIKTKAQENENIPDDKEVEIVAEIDAEIAEINSIKLEIEAATTREQIKELAKKLRDKWRELKHIIRFHTYRIVAARVMGIVNQGLVLEKRLDKILANLNESGIDVDVDQEVEDFKDKINESRDLYKQAQGKLSEVIDLRAAGEPADSETIKALLEEARDLLKQSRDALKEAHDLLKEIVKKIKEASPDADLSTETEVEVEQETSTDTEDTETETETNTTTEVNATT